MPFDAVGAGPPRLCRIPFGELAHGVQRLVDGSDGARGHAKKESVIERTARENLVSCAETPVVA